jgi:hypothetical protein
MDNNKLFITGATGAAITAAGPLGKGPGPGCRFSVRPQDP